MSAPPVSALPLHMHASASAPPMGARTTTSKKPDGSSTVYVHHISHGAQAGPQAPQQPAYVPYPMPMPAPPPMYGYPYPPAPASYGCPYSYHHQQQQQQPTVVVLQQEKAKPKEDDKKKKAEEEAKKKKAEEEKKKKEAEAKKKAEEAARKKAEEEANKGPQKFSKFSIVSIILFFLALVFGIACVFKTYEAYDGRMMGLTADDEDYVVDRTVAVGTGGAATMCFTIATLCSFYAGMRHKSKSKSKKSHCCLGGLVIAGWILFCLTFINALIILVLAFDEENVIYPEVVWTALIGSILSWMLMFGYSEMARRL